MGGYMPSRDQPLEATTVSMLTGGGRAIDLVVVALEGMKGGELIRHQLNSEQTRTLVAAVADTPASSR
jgi:hypothetical protein